MKIGHFLGFHNPINSKETGEVKFEFQSVFDLMITKYTEYQCECGRKFYMPKGSFEEWKMQEITYQMIVSAVKELEKRGEYDKAIELLKL